LVRWDALRSIRDDRKTSTTKRTSATGSRKPEQCLSGPSIGANHDSQQLPRCPGSNGSLRPALYHCRFREHGLPVAFVLMILAIGFGDR
jgi:hypothetical protein